MPSASLDHQGEPAGLEPIAWRPIAVVVAVVFVAHTAIATRYGWHRDEFYYVVTGRRLAWGYPDQPPVTSLLARLADELPGGLLPLRLVAIAAECSTILLGALTAREMGGGRRAQALAAGCVAGGAILMGASLLLGTTGIDAALWALIIWATLRAIRIGSMRSWLLVGVAAGIGLENKHTVAVLMAGLFLGLLATRRTVLAGPGPWIAAAIALALWAPNLWWDHQHNWITLDMARTISDKQGGIGGGLAQLPLLLFLLPSPLLFFMWMRGAQWGLRHQQRATWSWLVIGAGIITVALTLSGGKPYYSAPLLVPLFALGAVATERMEMVRGRRIRWMTPVVVLAGVSSAALSLPFAPPSFLTAVRDISPTVMETYGWPSFARQVQRAAADEPSATAVYVSNYGESGALQWFGSKVGFSLPVVIGQNAYKLWGPPPGTPDHVLAVGQFDRAFLRRSWKHVEVIRRITLPDGLVNEETDSDATIFRCSGPKGSWAQLWDRLSYLS